MDDEAVLRELGADLERQDPALAAMLSGADPHRGHPWLWVAGFVVVGLALLIAPAVTFGVLAMLLVLASPLLACWWCAFPGDDAASDRL